MLLSKLYSIGTLALRQKQDIAPGFLAPRRPAPEVRAPKRHMMGLVPDNQYDNNKLPKKMQLAYCLTHNWETIPLFICVVIDFIVIFYGAVYTGLTQKVEPQFSRHDWNCISRNMDLRNPTIHKHITLHQRYDPWPEMQDVLDKMTKAEHRSMTRAKTCPASE